MSTIGRLLCVAVAAAVLATVACGGGEPAPREAPRAVKAPAWQDVFEGTPEVLGVIRPKALLRDGVYGNLFRTVLRAAIAKSALRGTSGLELVESCDEVVFAATTPPADPELRRLVERRPSPPSVMLVLSGVGAAYDPAKLVDAQAQPLLALRDERARVPEYDSASPGGQGALFVLPGRTWVIAEGSFANRARQAFAAPAGRPRPAIDDDALFAVRIGPEIVSAPKYVKSPVFGPIVRKLDSVTVALEPAGKGVRVMLTYADEDAAAYGDLQAKQLVSGIAESDPKRFAWLAEATGSRSARTVTVRLPVPPRLLEDLPKALPPDVLGL